MPKLPRASLGEMLRCLCPAAYVEYMQNKRSIARIPQILNNALSQHSPKAPPFAQGRILLVVSYFTTKSQPFE